MIGMHNRSVARNAASVFVLVTSLLAFAHSADAQTKYERIVDTKFDVSVAKPVYKDKHPAVLFDNAHFNYHTSDGLYKPLVDLITNDGYRVTPNKQLLSAKGLDGFDNLLGLALDCSTSWAAANRLSSYGVFPSRIDCTAPSEVPSYPMDRRVGYLAIDDTCVATACQRSFLITYTRV